MVKNNSAPHIVATEGRQEYEGHKNDHADNYKEHEKRATLDSEDLPVGMHTSFEPIPPSTPISAFDFQNSFDVLHKIIERFHSASLPIVRETGVREAIERLAVYLGCTDYKFNLYQFWFLDIITDCLWRLQDEFNLPQKTQKTVIEWIIFIFDRIKDPKSNRSRKELLRFFKESILMASEIINEGCPDLPEPEELFQLIQNEENTNKDDVEEATSSSSSISSSSISISSCESDDNASYIHLTVDGESVNYALPREEHNCERYDFGSTDDDSESEVTEPENAESAVNEENCCDERLCTCEFYKSDHDIPARFQTEPEELQCEEEEKVEEEDTCSKESNVSFDCIPEGMQIDTEENMDDAVVADLPGEFEITSSGSEYSCESRASRTEVIAVKSSETKSPPKMGVAMSSSYSMSKNLGKLEAKPSVSKSVPISPSSITSNAPEDEKPKETEEENRKIMFKQLYEQKLLELKMADLADPKVGWPPEPESVTEIVQPTDEEQVIPDEDAWFDILENNQKEVKYTETNRFLNFGALWSIIQFIFDYFYESFQFALIKLAFHACPDLITQHVNEEWNVPKMNKGELLKPPKPKAKKKGKKKNKKKGKKGKKSKKSKSSKSSKKSKRSSRSSKSSKKKGKKGKKDKKGKKKKLTKEERAELARLKKEQEALEAERLRLEENRRFMFPLTEAAPDELFMDLFEDWVKIDITKASKKDKKGKKGKKGKKDKKGKKKGKK